eukprot:RCo028028
MANPQWVNCAQNYGDLQRSTPWRCGRWISICHGMPVLDISVMLRGVGEKFVLPKEWDWRLRGVVSPVKDQGRCGSCWAFSAVETVESIWAIKTGSLNELSVQQILDCTNNSR